MKNKIKKFIIISSIIITALIIIFISWYSYDIDPIEDQAFLPTPISNHSNGYTSLLKLDEEFRSNPTKYTPNLFNKIKSEQIDDEELFKHPFVQKLPEKINKVNLDKNYQERTLTDYLEKRPFLESSKYFTNIICKYSLYLWNRNKRHEALSNLLIIDKFINKLSNQRCTYYSFLIVTSMYEILDNTRLKILETNNLTKNDYQLLLQFQDRPNITSQMRELLKWDYKLSFEYYANNTKGIKRIAYCENRTKKFWIELMSPIFESLNRDKLYLDDKYFIEYNGRVEKYISDVFSGRNAIGRMYMSANTPMIYTFLYKIKRMLIKHDIVTIYTYLKQYKFINGKYPISLDQLNLDLPKDPWSNYKSEYKYSVKTKNIYSIGRNKLNDSGDYKSESKNAEIDKFFNHMSPDFGINII